MRPGANFEWKFKGGLWAVTLLLVSALAASERAFPHDISRARNRDYTTESSSTPSIPGVHKRQLVTQFLLDYDGDHSLDLATVVEQAIGTFSRYTIELRLASGAEQSIAVTAPPGGLQLEMHDMTGDKVQNDLVLRPALLGWLPTILINDGHDHFVVAIAGTEPGAMSSGLGLASRGSADQGVFALLSSGFKASGLMNDGELFLPQVQEKLLSPTTQTISQRLGYSFSSARAPPPALVITA